VLVGRKGRRSPLVLLFMRYLSFLLLVFLLSPPLEAQTCSRPRTALVLSGGGAKGLAHIGVLRVLDSLGIRPDLIVGTSMGAMIGGMYASGYSAREIDSLARALPIGGLFRTYQPRAPRSLGLLQPLIVLEQGSGRFVLQTATIREPEVNALVNAAMLRGNLIARGDFDALPIPFRAVATDLSDRQAVVIARGDLAQAVRASFAIPLIFSPESLDGRLLADGGLSANIPISVARQAGAERVIVSDATEQLSDSLDLFSPLVLADRLLGFLFRQSEDSLREGDVLVRPMVDGFTSLNFSPARVDELIRNGMAAANATLPPATCRNSPPAAAPALPARTSSLTIASTNASERLAIQRLLGLEPNQKLDVPLLRNRIQHLGQSDAFRTVWLSPRGVADSVSFHVTAQRAARRVLGLGVAYDNELGGRLWAGAVEQRLFDLALEGSTALFLGDFRQELLLGFRRNYQLGRQLMTPTLTARFALEQIRRFSSEGDELRSGHTREAVGFLGVERAIASGWELAGGLMGHAWHEPDRDRSTLGLEVRGLKVRPSREPVLQAGLSWTGIYQKAAVQFTGSLRSGRVGILPRLRLGWGDGLPLQSEFALGGDDGFPGLHVGERRGNREALIGLMLTYELAGPFVARAELVSGRTRQGGGLVGSAGWLTGVRAGLGAHTPVGPVRVEYGVASTGRGAVFVRLGRWF
jgi:NTE family protein